MVQLWSSSSYIAQSNPTTFCWPTYYHNTVCGFLRQSFIQSKYDVVKMLFKVLFRLCYIEYDLHLLDESAKYITKLYELCLDILTWNAPIDTSALFLYYSVLSPYLFGLTIRSILLHSIWPVVELRFCFCFSGAHEQCHSIGSF